MSPASAQRRVALGLVPLALVLPWLLGSVTSAPSPLHRPLEPGPVAASPRGASLGLFASDPAYDYAPLLDELTSRGAGDVLIVDRLMQSTRSSDDLGRVPGQSPSEATLERTVAQARARGMRVGLMPIVGVVDGGRDVWRGALAPAAGADAWFASYRARVLSLARLAEALGVERLLIGSELNWIESRDDLFRSLVDELRAVYRGALLYSANWDRYRAVRFWDALDGIAVSAYFRLESDGRPTRARARAHWAARLAELRAFADAHERPLLLSEVGYPAHAEAAAYPWDETRPAPLDQALQAELLGGFCDAHDARSGGFYVWNWFGRGGPRDPGYSPRGKPAAAVFERCMRAQ